MREIIWLTVNHNSVTRMTKKLPVLARGEIPIKLEIVVDAKAFQTPTIVKTVHVEDWRQGVDISDVNFTELAITEAEATMIREQRLARMAEILREQGYAVAPPEDPS